MWPVVVVMVLCSAERKQKMAAARKWQHADSERTVVTPRSCSSAEPARHLVAREKIARLMLIVVCVDVLLLLL